MSEQPMLENPIPPIAPTKSKRTGIVIAFAVILALLLLLATGLKKVQAGPIASGMASDFTITDFRGQTVTLSELRGQVVIVNFWASWCPPCREEAAYLEQTWRKYKDKGVIFIGIDWVDTEKEALAYIDEFDITYLNGPDIGTAPPRLTTFRAFLRLFLWPKMAGFAGFISAL